MVYNLDSDFAGFGRVERPTFRGIQHRPCRLINLCAKGTLQLVIRIVGTGKISMADEEEFERRSKIT